MFVTVSKRAHESTQMLEEGERRGKLLIDLSELFTCLLWLKKYSVTITFLLSKCIRSFELIFYIKLTKMSKCLKDIK